MVGIDEERAKKSKYLYKFLKKKRCIDKYVEEIKDANVRPMEKFEKDGDILALIYECGTIFSAFCWADSKYGFEYWQKLHAEYIAECCKLAYIDEVVLL